jgi:RNA recognition motif-containing protein
VNLQNGDHSGSGFIRFNSIESATAARQALNGTQTARGEEITVEFAKPPKENVNRGSNHKPNERLYFRGFYGELSDIRTVFQEFSDSIKDISLCMLFTL